MAGYFSFRRLIGSEFIKAVYVLGLMALTAAGIALVAWAAVGLRSATLPPRIGINYILIGVGILIAGNLAWRVICEMLILLFNIHALLASIYRGMKHDQLYAETDLETVGPAPKQKAVHGERRVGTVHAEKRSYNVAPAGSVLGLS